jgi:hypothetical protein
MKKPKGMRSRKGPEAIIQKAIIGMLRIKGWHVMVTHGSMYQSGFPDLFACHYRYGIRWIEVKLPGMKGSKFTPAQLESFPKMCANGAGVWILTGATELEYQKLFTRFNWWQYTSAAK